MVGQYILANAISPLTTRKAIRLRLVRTYEVREKQSGNDSISKECLFHDEEGTYVHAKIPKEHIEKYKHVLKEGSVYAIRNFLVVTNFYQYKTSHLKFMMKFNYLTTVFESKKKSFPTHMFRLKNFEAFKQPETIDEKELIDVIGRVVEFCNPMELTVGGRPSKLINFWIEDASNNRVKCTMWDAHVDKIMPYFTAVIEGPLIVLIQLCRVKKFNDSVQLSSSYAATQLWFNLESPEFLEFKRSLRNKESPIKSVSSRYSNSCTLDDLSSGAIEMTAISKLYDHKKLGEFYVPAKIVGIESIREWYYNSCMGKGCNGKKLTPKGGSSSSLSDLTLF